MPKAQADELLTVKECVPLLPLSQRTIYRLVASGRIRSLRLGPRGIRIPASEVDRLLTIPNDATAA